MACVLIYHFWFYLNHYILFVVYSYFYVDFFYKVLWINLFNPRAIWHYLLNNIEYLYFLFQLKATLSYHHDAHLQHLVINLLNRITLVLYLLVCLLKDKDKAITRSAWTWNSMVFYLLLKVYTIN